MQLDELRSEWAAHGALLERSLAIDERLLRETILRKVRGALLPHTLTWGIETLLGVVTMIAAAKVVLTHVADARYLSVGGALLLYVGAITACCASLLRKGLGFDHGSPVARIQRDVARMKKLEYQSFKWALLGGFVLWLPLLLVLVESATGFDALARIELSWLVSNLLVGLVVLGAGLAWSRKYVDGTTQPAFGARVVDTLSGHGLRRASEHLAELSRFVRDDEEVRASRTGEARRGRSRRG
jgi:hypothetical protein